MKLGWTLEEALVASFKDVKRSTVNCGSCPVSFQCVAAEGGNGFTFDCCRSTAVEVTTDGMRILLIVDCANHQFVQRDVAKDAAPCPLCSGDFVLSHLLGMSLDHHYLPTEYAKVPLKTRLDLWRAKLPEAKETVRELEEREKNGLRDAE